MTPVRNKVGRFFFCFFFLNVSLLISKTKTLLQRKHAVKAAKSNRNLPSKDSLIKMPLHAKLSLFACVISGERSANRPKKLRNDAFQVRTSQSAKNQLDPAKNENRPKKRYTPFLHEALHLLLKNVTNTSVLCYIKR